MPLVENLIKDCEKKLKSLNVPELLNSSLMLKSVLIPSQLVDEFIALSYANTERDIETLGILAGFVSSTNYQISALVIPKQQGCGDSCECTDDLSLFNCLDSNNWQVMGWIHTHPSHDLFLSSVDLHTHANYQWLFPEAIAIVFAPTHRKQLGTFRLTSQGLQTIRNCKLKGFHPHEKSIYREATNVEMVQDLPFTKIDLR